MFWWNAAADDIDHLQGSDLFRPHGTNVSQVGYAGPALGEDGAAVGLDPLGTARMESREEYPAVPTGAVLASARTQS